VHQSITAGRAEGVIISARLTPGANLPALGALVRAMAVDAVIGLIDDGNPAEVLAGTLLLGHAGVCCIADVRTPPGWTTLRRALAPDRLPSGFLRAAVRTVIADLATGADHAAEGSATPPTDGFVAFLHVIFTPGTRTGCTVAQRLGVTPSSFTSRFFRAGLPSPKRYIVGAQLVCIAHLAERPGASLAMIAHHLEASSPQSLGRTIRTYTGLRPGELRDTYSGDGMLQRFREQLVVPYAPALRTFDPLAPTWQELGRAASRRLRRSTGPWGLVP